MHNYQVSTWRVTLLPEFCQSRPRDGNVTSFDGQEHDLFYFTPLLSLIIWGEGRGESLFSWAHVHSAFYSGTSLVCLWWYINWAQDCMLLPFAGADPGFFQRGAGCRLRRVLRGLEYGQFCKSRLWNRGELSPHRGSCRDVNFPGFAGRLKIFGLISRVIFW